MIAVNNDRHIDIGNGWWEKGFAVDAIEKDGVV